MSHTAELTKCWDLSCVDGIYRLSFLSTLTAATSYIFVPSVVVTHALGLVAHLPKSAKAHHILRGPWEGGRHHFIFQMVAWALWGASVLLALPVLAKLGAHLNRNQTDLVSSASAIGSVFAELFMVKSLLVFDPPQEAAERLGRRKSAEWRRTRVPEPLTGAAIVGMGCLWTILGVALLAAALSMQDFASLAVHAGLSGCCILVGAFITHGVAGKLRHRALLKEARDEIAESMPAWRFWQPFSGGKAFVAVQGLGWVLFAASIASIIWLVIQVAAGFAYCVRCWALMTSSFFLSAELVLALSLLAYKRDSLLRRMPSVPTKPSTLAERFALHLPVLMFYTPVHSFTTVVVVTALLLPLNYWLAAWVGGLTVYYLLTVPGEPEHNGKREWPALKAWLGRQLQPALEAWCGRVEVVNEGTKPLSPDQRYVFGYHPHGLFPIGAPYVKFLPDFRRHFPGIDPVPLVASVLFYTPMVRDLISWCGVRQVAKRTFLRALRERNSVILVPGGQAELLHTWRAFQPKELVIHCRHKGFVKVAAEHGAALVPIAALGEVTGLRNAIDIPWMQAWSYKRLGFPVPYLVVGRWGCTPFPRRTGLRFVVGEPIPIPTHLHNGCTDKEFAAGLDTLHKQYFDAVEALFRKHMPTFPGYEKLSLIMLR